MASSGSQLRRALHYVFKIPDRAAAITFYTKILGMRVLRHEEFETGCKAACNGRYDGFWSKTMIGYGPEDTHFVMELTFNYGVDTYRKGNEFRGIVIEDCGIIKRCEELKYATEKDRNRTVLNGPGGHKFYIVDKTSKEDPVKQVIYSCTDVAKTSKFWVNTLGCRLLNTGDDFLEVAYDEAKTSLRFEKISEAMDRGEAYGRIAFACPKSHLPELESQVKNGGLGSVITPLVSLSTPGKASVEVVILGDPDGHEICFVGDEAFRELSKEDPTSLKVLQEHMAEYEAFLKKTSARPHQD